MSRDDCDRQVEVSSPVSDPTLAAQQWAALPSKADAVNDKSPRQQLSNKSKKSIKEKRADKRAKPAAQDPVDPVSRKSGR